MAVDRQSPARGAGLRFLGHPLHPALVHLPLGLCVASLLWDVAGILARRGGLGWAGLSPETWFDLGRVTLVVGLVTAVPAAITGFIDYVAIPADDPAESTAGWHLLATGSALTAFLAGLLLRLGAAADDGDALVVGMSALGASLLGLGGWLGGHLVYEHGVGRSPPKGDAGRERIDGSDSTDTGGGSR